MFKKLILTTVLSHTFLGALRADSATIELRHMAATKFLQIWTSTGEAHLSGAFIQKVVTSTESMLNGTTMTAEERTNSLTVEGDAKLVAMARDLAKSFDEPPIMVRLNCVRLRSTAKEGSSVHELLGKPDKNGFPGGNNAMESLLQKAKDSGQIEIVSNSQAICKNNEHAAFTTSSAEGGTFETVITPLVNSKEEINLSIDSTMKKNGGTSEVRSTITMPNGDILLTESKVDKDTSGKTVEYAVLIQASIVDKNTATPKVK